MELMSGFPPREADLVTLANWRKPPFNRWAFHHVNELVPSAVIRTHGAASGALTIRPEPLQGVEIAGPDGPLDLPAWLDATFTDSMVVLKNGSIVYETYAPGQDAATPHIWMSVSKSVLGLLAGIVAGQGRLDVAAPITDIIPELRATAYAGATVRDLLDMRAGIRFDENYLAADGAIIEYRKSHLWDPVPVGQHPSDLRSFFGTLTVADGRHDDRFHYVSPNTDLLGWVIERSTGQRYADLVSDLLWKPLQAERDAFVTVDRFGAARCAGGFCATPRDMARLGRLFVSGGTNGGRRIVPTAWLDDIVQNGSVSAWRNGDFDDLFDGASMHYRSKWYVLRGERPLIFGLGVFGQNVFVDPEADLVIAKCSSQPLPIDKGFLSLTMQGVEALRRQLG